MYRMTHKKTNGKAGYWSPNKKEEVVNRLATYENTGLEPRQVQELKKKILEQSSKSNDGWIPVEERLPENGHSVLICGIHGWIDVGWYIRGTWRTGFSAAEIVKEVVAWMPLPEPYKPERREGE